MKIFIKNMITTRCKAIAEKELQALGIHYSTIELGEVKIIKPLTIKQEHELRINLVRHNLELLDDKKAKLLEKIKNVIIEMIHYIEKHPKINYSNYISGKLQYDYTYLANLFSAVHRTTIEQCIIAHKIERVKELLVDHELNLTQIAHKLHYSSVGHLANQFKKVTGITTSHFKKLENKGRISLEEVCG